MARARIKEDWLHTSHILEMLANVNRDPKRRRKPYSWKDFHPMFIRKEKSQSGRVSISDVMCAVGLKQKEDHAR